MIYRPEVDGLRSVAVVPVILFHAQVPGLSGGYLGVDVFFVISGYLITALLYRDLEVGQFSIRRFYERRARRILPALIFMLAVSTSLAFALLPPYLLKLYAQSLFATATFLSNVHFPMVTDYFGTGGDEEMLLHTWSLSVEEQFYVLFPLLILACSRGGRSRIVLACVAAASVSFLTAIVLERRGADAANFYYISSRAWELLAGSLAALLPRAPVESSPRLRAISSSVGLTAIIGSMLTFSPSTPHPGLPTVLPVLGTCLFLRHADSLTPVGNLLSRRLLVGIGLISYSLYLWHQPLLALVRVNSIGAASPYTIFGAVILACILAVVSYRYIEQPFRTADRGTDTTTLPLSGAALVATAALGLAGHLNSGFPNRYPDADYTATMTASPARQECHTAGQRYRPPSRACTYASGPATWAVLGDSHAIEIAWALGERLAEHGESVLHLSFSSCPPAAEFETQVSGCAQWLEEALGEIESRESVRNVLLVFRHTFYLYGDQLHSWPEAPSRLVNQYVTTAHHEASEHEVKPHYWRSFRSIVDRLNDSGRRVHTILPIPELPAHVGKVLAPASIASPTQTRFDPRKVTTMKYYLERHEVALDELSRLAADDAIESSIDPTEFFCDTDHCAAAIDEKALYFDDDHVSVEGARLLVEGLDLGPRTDASLDRSARTGM